MAARARILAIDDQQYFRDLLVGLLSAEGYEVVASAPGAASRVLAEQDPFDLVILDGAGRGTSAGDAVAAIRTRAPDALVLVLTGIDDVRSAVDALHQGASDYLLKPIDRGAVLAAVHRALQRRSAAAAPTQLLDENIEFMGRLSLLERVLPLVSEPDVSALACGLLELCCVEACGTAGILWLCQDRIGTLTVCARFGGQSGSPAPEAEPSPPSSSVLRTLASGMAVIACPEGDGKSRTAPALYVPFVADGTLVAVAQVSERVTGEFTEPDAQASLEVGELGGAALHNAILVGRARAESLREPRTGLLAHAFFREVIETELQKAHRFGRRLCCMCIEVDLALEDARMVEAVVEAQVTTLRTTDVLCAESPRRYWVLVTETDPLGGVVLKRRMAEGIRTAVGALGRSVELALGVASYPLDGETREALMTRALERVAAERKSVIHEIGFDVNEPLSRIGERLLSRAVTLPASTLACVAEFLIGELTCRPHDSGLLFLAPGGDPAPILAPLMAMGDAETATEVFLATDGDTVPACPSLTAVALPPDFSPDTTWLVRFGEGPPYAMLAGPPQEDGTRRIYHSTDSVLVEHMTFRLCAEVGVGVRS